jgi:hypothetical protein
MAEIWLFLAEKCRNLAVFGRLFWGNSFVMRTDGRFPQGGVGGCAFLGGKRLEKEELCSEFRVFIETSGQWTEQQNISEAVRD